MKNLKQIIVIGLLLIISQLNVNSQGVGINSDGSAPDASAMLDVKSTTTGFLVPRMDAGQKTSISLPATGLLIFQTDGTSGFYYNSGTPAAPDWIMLFDSDIGWALTGNANTTPGTNFLGTTDAQDLVIKTNNTEQIRVNTDGKTGIGITPSSKLHIAGTSEPNSAIQIDRYSADGFYPLIRFRKSRGATIGSYATVVDNDILGWISFKGSNNSSFGRSAAIIAKVNGSPGDADNFIPSDLYFCTSPDATTDIQTRIIIKKDGKVGIGSDVSPLYKLDVDGDVRVRGNNLYGGATGAFYIHSNGSITLDLDDDSNGSEYFKIRNGSNNVNFTVSEAGNVDAEGYADFNGNLTLSGSVARAILGPTAAPLDIKSETGIDVYIDNDDNGTGSEFYIKTIISGSDKLLFRVDEDGDATVYNRFKITPLAAQPSGTEGDFYSDNTANIPYYHDGTAWRPLATQNWVNTNGFITTSDLWDRSGTNTYLQNSGDNVGIGTPSPDGKLHITNSTGNDARVYIERPSTSEEASIRFQTAETNNWFLGLDDPGTGNEDFRLYSYTFGDYVVTVDDATGNVGIGVSPSEKLEVSGKTKTTSFQMTSGAVNEYILQSDASGNASWVDPSSVGGTCSHYIGESYGGGIIFKIDYSGCHGLISATNNQSESAQWYTDNVTPAVGGTLSGMMTGSYNTTLIDNYYSTSGIAAEICQNLSLGGYDNWFLPSKDELNEMYMLKDVIGFTAIAYWSSTEVDLAKVWTQHLGTGAQSSNTNKTTANIRVRCIRSF